MDTLNTLKNMLNETDWDFFSNNDEILIENKNIPPYPVTTFRLSGLVKGNSNDLYNEIMNYTERDWKNYDNDIIDQTTIQKEENKKINSQIHSLPWPLWSKKKLHLRLMVLLMAMIVGLLKNQLHILNLQTILTSMSPLS